MTLIGSKAPVSSACFKPNRLRFFLPGSCRRPFSSGTTATEVPKNRLNSFLPWSSDSASPPGAILPRKPLMMPVPVVSPLKVCVPVLSTVGSGCSGGRVVRASGCTGCGSGCCTGVYGRGCAGAGADCDTGFCSRSSSASPSGKARVSSGSGSSGSDKMPTLRRISSTWWSVTLSRRPACACCIFSSSRIRSTESLVRLLGMLIPL